MTQSVGVSQHILDQWTENGCKKREDRGVLEAEVGPRSVFHVHALLLILSGGSGGSFFPGREEVSENHRGM